SDAERADRADREREKVDLLQRLGIRAPAAEPAPTAGEVEQEHETVVETAAVSPEDAAEVVGPLADRPTSAEIRELIRRELASSMDAELAAAEAHKARLADLIKQQAEAEAREAR